MSRTRKPTASHGSELSAIDAVRYMHAVADIVRRHDYPVEVVQTERAGYVVYEDEWQIVAEPFHGEQR